MESIGTGNVCFAGDRQISKTAFRNKALLKASEVGFKKAAEMLKINELDLHRWRYQNCGDLKKKLNQNEKHWCWPDLEEQLSQWIKAQKENGFMPSTFEIRCKSKTIANELSLQDFTGCGTWCYRFLKRFEQNEGKALKVALENENILPHSINNGTLQSTGTDIVHDNLHPYGKSETCNVALDNQNGSPHLINGLNVESTEAFNLPIKRKSSYSKDFKQCVLQLVTKIGKRETSRLTGVHVKTIYNWWNERNNLELLPKWTSAANSLKDRNFNRPGWRTIGAKNSYSVSKTNFVNKVIYIDKSVFSFSSA